MLTLRKSGSSRKMVVVQDSRSSTFQRRTIQTGTCTNGQNGTHSRAGAQSAHSARANYWMTPPLCFVYFIFETVTVVFVFFVFMFCSCRSIFRGWVPKILFIFVFVCLFLFEWLLIRLRILSSSRSVGNVPYYWMITIMFILINIINL